MKQLFINGNATTLFFKNQTSFDNIFEWIKKQIMFSETNLFNLNEQYSCIVEKDNINIIKIKGDEDLMIITIEEIIPLL